MPEKTGANPSWADTSEGLWKESRDDTIGTSKERRDNTVAKKILIVDDDHEMLLSLQEGLEKYRNTFMVFLAKDGMAASKMLKEHSFSLVVTDLKMPRMDGFALLAHIMEQYPEVPVIIMTGYSTPEMERLTQNGGLVGCIEKPFMIDDLSLQIMATLRKESDGGTLHGVSSGMFLQLIEMEQKTCTIRLTDKETGKQGVLFFRNGDLLDARVNGLQGLGAAYEIFAWDEVSLSIQNECFQNEKRIKRELQAILLEAMRLKDERALERLTIRELESADVLRDEPASQGTLGDSIEDLTDEWEPEDTSFISGIRSKMEEELGEICGLVDICKDASWDSLIAQFGRIGALFDVGEFAIGFVDTGDPYKSILIPDSKTTVISVTSKCPRDRILEILLSRR